MTIGGFLLTGLYLWLIVWGVLVVVFGYLIAADKHRERKQQRKNDALERTFDE